jgi:hypothetical protein
VTGEPTVADLRREFPDWTIYKGIDQRWRARLTSAKPPVPIVVDDDLDGLREEIVRKVSQLEAQAWAEGRRST